MATMAVSFPFIGDWIQTIGCLWPESIDQSRGSDRQRHSFGGAQDSDFDAGAEETVRDLAQPVGPFDT